MENRGPEIESNSSTERMYKNTWHNVEEIDTTRLKKSRKIRIRKEEFSHKIMTQQCDR